MDKARRLLSDKNNFEFPRTSILVVYDVGLEIVSTIWKKRFIVPCLTGFMKDILEPKTHGARIIVVDLGRDTIAIKLVCTLVRFFLRHSSCLISFVTTTTDATTRAEFFSCRARVNTFIGGKSRRR